MACSAAPYTRMCSVPDARLSTVLSMAGQLATLVRKISGAVRLPWSAPVTSRLAGRAGLPYNRIVWPGTDASLPLVWDAATAMALPGVARAVAIYSGLTRQMPIDAYRGTSPLPRPRILDQPDPNAARPWFVGVHVEDYLLNGNALNYITAYDSTGWPAAVTWLPATWVSVTWSRDDPVTRYLIDGEELDPARVVHVRRGADRWCPARGVGVVEQHLRSLDRIASEEEYERETLNSSGVPSVAVITPNPKLGSDEAVKAKADWMSKFAGPRREPAILPGGTQVVPLGWSPDDAQMTAARQMSLLDIANMFNLDGYYLGAPTSSLTYQSPGPNYTALLRMSLEPVLSDIEGTWSMSWLPMGRTVRFDRSTLTRDDLATTINTLATATAAGLMSIDEARLYLGLPASPAGPTVISPVATEAIAA